MHPSSDFPGEEGSISWRGFRTPVTQRCAEVLINAFDIARTFRHDYTGTEHLLLAMLRTPGSDAASVLGSLADPAVIVRECEHRIRNTSTPGPGSDPSYTLTRQLQAVIRRAESHADAQTQSAVSTRHLLHGVVDEVTTMAYEVLVAGRISPADLRKALSQS